MSDPGAPQSSERSATIGKYRLIASLGRGGMADVFLAVVSGPAGFNKLQVVKLLRAHLAPDPEFVAMFLDEARLAARLNHPNVVQTNEVGEANGGYFIAMEYLEGQAFSRFIRHAPVAISLRVLGDVLAGLHYAHELRDYDGSPLDVVHRDASPHNIFVGYDGQVKLVDFGIAKAATSSTETLVGMIKGKVSYMSPEQASGTGVDRRSDVFCVGIVLWEAIAGRRIWEGLSDVQIIHALALGNLPKLSSAKPDVDPALEAIAGRALALSREDRYATAQELREALLGYLDAIGKRPSQEQVGAFVSKMFTEKREGIRALVEQQLNDLGKGAGTLRIVDVDGGGARMSGTSQDRASSTPSRPSGRTESAVLGDRISVQPPSGPLSAPGGLVASQRPPEDTSVSPMLADQRRASRAASFGLLAVFAVAAMGIGLAARYRPAHTDRRSASAGGELTGAQVATGANSVSAEAPASSAMAPLPTARAARVEVRFAATPPAAVLTLDGRSLPANPYTALVEADDKPHELRAAAPGFIAETREIMLEAQGHFEVTLSAEATPLGKTPLPPLGGKISGPLPGKSPQKSPPPGGAGKRTIDKSNPWSE